MGFLDHKCDRYVREDSGEASDGLWVSYKPSNEAGQSEGNMKISIECWVIFRESATRVPAICPPKTSI